VWRHLSAGVNRAEPGSKSSYHAEPPRPCGALDTLWLHGPAERQFGRNELRSLTFEEVQKVLQGPGGLLELRTESPAERHILWESIAEAVHRTPPMTGHG
jgi:hypothetical protein